MNVPEDDLTASTQDEAARTTPDGPDASLTCFEVAGLNAPWSMADGHATHCSPAVLRTWEMLPELRDEAERVGVVAATDRLVRGWAAFASEPDALRTRSFVAPTASVSIDFAFAAIKERGKAVWLIEPTFDNISSIGERRGVPILPLAEDRLHEDPLGTIAALVPGDTLFIVHPNNPTGRSLSDQALDMIFADCARRGVPVVLDCTFRFFGACAEQNLLGRLLASGVSFILIEDTGKTWPTHELKASITFYSADWSRSIERVFKEIFLSSSSVLMLFFEQLFRDERAGGFPAPLHALVRERRGRLRALLAGTRLQVAPESVASKLPVEWIDIAAASLPDLALVDHIVAQTGVQLLPGRQFYWSRQTQRRTDRIRISLLKSQSTFDEGMARLETFLRGDF